MCGRLNVIDDPLLKALSKALGVSDSKIKKSYDIAPGATLSVIRGAADGRLVTDATWWLFLDSESLKPNHKYASFNSRSDKLDQPRSLAYKPFRSSRCIIPASGFVEGLGDKKTYYHLRPEASAIAFGGLFKEWLNKDTGELVYSASIITLPPHEKLQNIHPKSIPLMLPWQDEQLINMWLDPAFNQVEAFNDLLIPRIREGMIVTPIDKPSKRNPVGEELMLQMDAA